MPVTDVLFHPNRNKPVQFQILVKSSLKHSTFFSLLKKDSGEYLKALLIQGFHHLMDESFCSFKILRLNAP